MEDREKKVEKAISYLEKNMDFLALQEQVD